MKKANELRQERAELVKQASAVLNKEGALTPEDEEKFDKIMADADKMAENITRFEKNEKALADMAARVDSKADAMGVRPDEVKEIAEEEKEAFLAYLRGGLGNLTGEQRQIAAKRYSQGNPQNAQSVGTTTAGGYIVPQDFYYTLTEAQKAYGGMRDVATIIKTENGQALPMPMVNETSNAGSILAENTQITGLDVAFSQKTLNAYMYTSGLVLVSYQLMQDSAFDLNDYLAKALGTRLARAQNTHFTTGDGSAKPAGIVPGATLGATGASGQTATVIFDDLVGLIHSVDPLYRKNARFMMKDSSLGAIRKIKDSQNRPIYLPAYDGLAGPAGDTIMGYPVTINQDMDAMASDAKSILFGDFSTYMIREVLGTMVLRLAERYADYLQVGFLAYNRVDGALLDAGTHPVKYYINSHA